MSAIDLLNGAMAAEDDRLTREFGPPEKPVVIVFSQPRGASTLFQQLAISCLDIGYISNLLARFWRAPYLGAQLEQSVRDPEYVSNFGSRYGNVAGAQEPHEWGWFWRHWLKLGGDETYCPQSVQIDSGGLLGKLGALEAVVGSSLLIDSIYAITNFDLLVSLLPRVVVVRLRRDLYYICNSHLNARLSRHGDIGAFYGHRPKNIEEILAIEDPVEQVVAQVKASEQEMLKTLKPFGAEGVFDMAYSDLVAKPQDAMNRFAEFLNDNGAGVRMLRPLPQLDLENRDNPRYIRAEHRERLDHYYSIYFKD